MSGCCTNGGNENSGGISIDYTGKVVADNVVVVGGVKVPTVHLMLRETMTGDTLVPGPSRFGSTLPPGCSSKRPEPRTHVLRAPSVGCPPPRRSHSPSTSLAPKQ